jgi:hypothetical protein
MTTDTLSLLRSGKLPGTKRLQLACGLTEFPEEIFELADTLEILDLSGNQLSSLPDYLPRLNRLRILFCSQNAFTHVPAVLGKCTSLSMVGFKANRIETVDENAFPPALRWFILTDNRIKELPATLGKCTRLQKLMLSGNQLTALPESMAACVNLELVRLAANNFHVLPDWLLTLPKLSWLALAGNPWSAAAEPDQQSLPAVDWAELELNHKLGEGASGVIHHASWQGAAGPQDVAVKLFKGTMTSDGLPSSEMAASMAVGKHPHMIEVMGQIANHPEGGIGLVMSLIDPSFKTLAGPPSFESCTRDVYDEDVRLSLPVLFKMALGIASAAERLHAQGITHGDLYAHNVMWNAHGDCLLGDFGGASFYPRQEAAAAHALQGVEVRAFGCLLEELLMRCDATVEQQAVMNALWGLQQRCWSDEVAARPHFAEIASDLRQIGAAVLS